MSVLIGYALLIVGFGAGWVVCALLNPPDYRP